MHADIQGALNQINKSYRAFKHRGKPLSKEQVKAVLNAALEKGYKHTGQISDDEVDKILNLTNK